MKQNPEFTKELIVALDPPGQAPARTCLISKPKLSSQMCDLDQSLTTTEDALGHCSLTAFQQEQGMQYTQGM